MFTNFFLYSSGTDRELLKHCPSERLNRYGSGVAVLFTTTLSVFSFTYALSITVHAPFMDVLPFGIGWGFFIYHLDRWLVGTMRVGKSAKEALRSAGIRLAIAVLFGALASDAMILKSFEPEIENHIAQKQMAERQKAEETINSRPAYREIERQREEIQALKTQVRERRNERDAAEREVIREIEGKSPTGKVGRGPAYAEKQAALRRAEADYRAFAEDATARIRQAEQQVTRLESRRDQELSVLARAGQKADGHLARLEALSALALAHPLVAAKCLLYWLFFMTLDCLAVVIKVAQAGRGKHPYETLLEEKEAAEILAGKLAVAGAGKLAAEIEEDRQKIERQNALQLHADTAKELAAIQQRLIQTEFLPEAEKRMRQHLRQHINKYLGPLGKP